MVRRWVSFPRAASTLKDCRMKAPFSPSIGPPGWWANDGSWRLQVGGTAGRRTASPQPT